MDRIALTAPQPLPLPQQRLAPCPALRTCPHPWEILIFLKFTAGNV